MVMNACDILGFNLNVAIERRDGYFAATTKPFAITVYGDSEEEAHKRAIEAVLLLLKKYDKTQIELTEYLKCRGVET